MHNNNLCFYFESFEIKKKHYKQFGHIYNVFNFPVKPKWINNFGSISLVKR